ncbi:MAG: TIGR00269 family protein [Candidatus Njordarchaeales archaeon]
MGCQPVYYKADAGRYFCREEFIKYFKRRVLKTIQKWKMFERDSKIAIAVSGGKDSMTLLHVLYEIEQKFPSELIIIHLDENIRGYSDVSRDIVRRASKELGLSLLEASYKELFGYSIDEVASIQRKERIYATCTFCGVWRRWGLNYLALKAGADRLATAHCLDDEAQTVILNILRGNFQNLLKMDPRPRKLAENVVPRVKPFREIPEREITLYAHLTGIEYNDVPCPYATEAMRWNIRIWLSEVEREHPGTLHNVLRFSERIAMKEQLFRKDVKINKCQICGFPAVGRICKAHQLKLYLDKLLKK